MSIKDRIIKKCGNCDFVRKYQLIADGGDGIELPIENPCRWQCQKGKERRNYSRPCESCIDDDCGKDIVREGNFILGH